MSLKCELPGNRLVISRSLKYPTNPTIFTMIIRYTLVEHTPISDRNIDQTTLSDMYNDCVRSRKGSSRAYNIYSSIVFSRLSRTTVRRLRNLRNLRNTIRSIQWVMWPSGTVMKEYGQENGTKTQNGKTNRCTTCGYTEKVQRRCASIKLLTKLQPLRCLVAWFLDLNYDARPCYTVS